MKIKISNKNEVLFRGKDRFNKWIYGNYCKAEKLSDEGGEENFIIEYGKNGSTHEIDIETLNQYTKKTDIKGNKIFEADIVKFKNGTEIGYVFYDDRILQYRIEIINNKYWKQTVFEAFDDFEVIGNIYDNVDLIELGEV